MYSAGDIQVVRTLGLTKVQVGTGRLNTASEWIKGE
jgi:hypothetical protein